MISGTFTALITPFDQKGHVDEEGLRKNIRFQISHGVEGVIALGTTGEAPTLTHREKELIVKIAREETRGKCHLMVGTGSYSTQQTIENTRAAKEAGADSALVVVPYYNKPTQEGLYQHFSTLAKEVALPIVVYNIQGRTGQNLQTTTLKRLVSIDSIIGVKEASGNLSQMMEVIETILPTRSDFSVLSGDDALTLPLIAMGGHGVCSVLSNLCPKEMKSLCDAALQGDYASARNIHYQLLPLMRDLFIETNPIPIKAAMNHVGHAAGPCRLPLCEMNKENLQILKQTVEKNKHNRYN